jgi:tetratricopeptide (TPR) repeat protein
MATRREALGEFAADLRRFHVECGSPTYQRLRSHSVLLPPASVSDVLNGKTAPRLEFVVEFVEACLANARRIGAAPPADRQDRQSWELRWREMRQALPPRDTSTLAVSTASASDDPDDAVRLVPQQLPAMPRHFVGRSADLAWIDSVAALGGTDTPTIVLLDGLGGVGKTALAVAWAHRQHARFPAGRLFAPLYGDSGRTPRAPEEILADFLRALGTHASRIPCGLDELTALYRTEVAARDVLLVLDGAADEEQVRPLLPSTAGGTAIVTSRRVLAGLEVRDGALRRTIRPLTPTASRQLVQHLVGERKLSRETVDRVATTCGHLPLALRLAGHRLAAQAATAAGRHVLESGATAAAVAELDDGIDDKSSKLSEVFGWSLEELGDDARRALQAVARFGPTGISAYTVAAILGCGLNDAREALNVLRDRSLLESLSEGRYAVHDLLGAWARGLPDADPEAQRRRLLGYFVHVADLADRALLPQRLRDPVGSDATMICEVPDVHDRFAALSWFDAELSSLVGATRLAVEAGDRTTAAVIPYLSLSYLNLRKPWHQWLEMFEVALSSTTGDTRESAHLHLGLGIAYRETGQTAQALTSFARSIRGYERAGDAAGKAMALNNIATCHTTLGDPRAAAKALRQALTTIGDSGDLWRGSIVLHNLAEADLAQGHLDDAVRHAVQARATALRNGDLDGAAASLTTLARAHAAQGQTESAQREYTDAIREQQIRGDRYGEAVSRKLIADLLDATGQSEEAHHHREVAVEIFEAMNDPRAESVRRRLNARPSR